MNAPVSGTGKTIRLSTGRPTGHNTRNISIKTFDSVTLIIDIRLTNYHHL